jgi:hypothetical protein
MNKIRASDEVPTAKERYPTPMRNNFRDRTIDFRLRNVEGAKQVVPYGLADFPRK